MFYTIYSIYDAEGVNWFPPTEDHKLERTSCERTPEIFPLQPSILIRAIKRTEESPTPTIVAPFQLHSESILDNEIKSVLIITYLHS